MQILTCESFFNTPWKFSHIEFFDLADSEGKEFKTGYIHYVNAAEFSQEIDDENKVSISFPWIAERNEYNALIVTVDEFETMFTCENFIFDANGIPDNKKLLNYFESKNWVYSLISTGELF